MKILFIGGPLDGQVRDVDEPISPVASTMIKATMPNGIIVQYHVDIFQGEKLRFPVACFEQLSPDDVFQALLQWYSVKPRVRPIDAPVGLPTEPTEPTEPSKIITPGD